MHLENKYKARLVQFVFLIKQRLGSLFKNPAPDYNLKKKNLSLK